MITLAYKEPKPILEILVFIAKSTRFISFGVFRKFANRLHRRDIFSFTDAFIKVLAQEFDSLRRMFLTRYTPIKHWINLLHILFGLVVAASPSLLVKLWKIMCAAISKSAELSSSISRSFRVSPVRCKVAYLEAATPQLFTRFRRPLVPLSIVSAKLLSCLPLSAERSSVALSERATRLKAKLATPMIGEATNLAPYSPIIMSTKNALIGMLANPYFLSSALN